MVLPEHMEGCPARPKAMPKYTMKYIGLPVETDRLVDEEYAASPYHDRMTRGEYICLLILAACNHEQKLREENASRGSLIEVHHKLPEGMAEAAERLRKLKEGVQ